MTPDLSHDSPKQQSMDLVAAAASQGSEIVLGDLIAVLCTRKWLIAIFAMVSMTGAAVLAWITPPTYTAEIVIAPVSTSSGGGQFGGIRSALGQLGGLATLAGIASSTDLQAAESIAVLKSEALTERYIAKNNLLPILYRKEWDQRKMRWISKDPDEIPTLWDATRYFRRKIRAITTDPKTGLVTLTIRWRNPHLAAKWANGLVQVTNDSLRTQAIDEAARNIEYLKTQAAATPLVPVKQAIYDILQTQINNEMLARGTKQYAFKVLDPAIPPERPSSPRTILWIALALASSVIFSILVAYVYLTWTRTQPPRYKSNRP